MMSESIKNSYFKKYINYILVSIVFLLASIPLLKTGFSGDDVFDNLVRGAMLRNHITLFGIIGHTTLIWLHTGRFFPAAMFLTFVFSYLFGTNLILYNFFHWCIVIFSYFLTCVFLKKLNLSTPSRLLFVCLLPFCWSVFPGSPLVSFGILLPALVIMMMLAFISYINFLNKKQMRYCFGAMLFSLLAFLTYEVSVVIIPVILLLNKYYEGKFFTKNKAMWLIFLITFLYLTFTLVIRHLFVISYGGVALGNPAKIPAVFFRQLFGSLPLLYFFSYTKKFYNLHWQEYSLALLLMSASFAAVSRLLSNKNSLYVAQSQWILFISIIFQVIPALLLGFTQQYQWFKIIHISVFLQQIGFVIMLVVLLQYLLTLPKLANYSVQFYSRVILALLISAMTGLSFLANLSFANRQNQDLQYPRNIYQQALTKGLFSQLPQHAVVLRPSFYLGENLWNTSDFFQLYLNRHDIIIYNFVQDVVAGLGQPKKPNLAASLLKDNVFYLDFKSVPCDAQCGYVFFAQVVSIKGIPPAIQLQLKNIKIFYTATSWRSMQKVLLSLNHYLSNDPQLTVEINKLINQQSPLSGLVALPSDINFSR